MNTEELNIESQNPIAVGFAENISDDVIAELINELQLPNTPAQIIRHRKGNEMWAALEFITPEFIMLFIAEQYFGGAIKEVGKDSYIFIKAQISKFIIKAREKVKPYAYSDGSEPKEISPVSILFRMRSGERIKLLFNVSLSNAVWQDSVDQFVNIMAEHNKLYPDDRLSELLSTIKSPDEDNSTFYATIDPETRNILIANSEGMTLNVAKNNPDL